MMYLLCIAAAFTGGALNTIAGGGSFLTLPALVYAGVPMVAANATGAAALLPGYLTGAWALRSSTGAASPLILPIRELLGLATFGGILGALVLAMTDDAVLRTLIPWLMLLATVMFMVGPAWIAHRSRSRDQTAPDAGAPTQWPTRIGLFVVCFYGGYFNGGMGILLLALFVFLGQVDMLAMNRAKNLASAVLTLMAVGVYALHDVIAWQYAPWMMAAGALGGWWGGWLARVLPLRYVRLTIVATGVVMTTLFFISA